MPDFIGLAEVENRGVLTRMLSSTALRKFDYKIIHNDSGDRRGIDVAILYRQSSMNLVSSGLSTPEFNGEKMATRDILHAEMCLPCMCTVDFIVNHHPSKFGGADESEIRRTAAMTALKNMCDSLDSEHVVVMGDFNDDPDSDAFNIVEDFLVNKSAELHERGEGTMKVNGNLLICF